MYKSEKYDFDWASQENGNKPAKEFFDSLLYKEKAKIKTLLERLGKSGELDENRFKKLQSKSEIWELKSDCYRLFCFKLGRCWYFTNGFKKSSQKTPQRQINMAKNIRENHIKAGKRDDLKGDKNV